MIKQALLSVSDKSGIVEFAKSLSELGVSLLSTGGTAKLLADAGLPVTEVADYTADVMAHWLRRGADGWRLDAAYAVPQQFWAAVLPRVRERQPDA